MKRILLTPLGSWGDINPFLRMGQILKNHGYEVSVIANPHFVSAIHALDLRWIPAGTEEEFQESIDDPTIWHRRKGTEAVFDFMGKVSGRIADLVASYLSEASSPPLVLAPATAFGVRMAREKQSFPLATVHLQPPALLSAYALPHFGKGTGWIRHLPLPMRKSFIHLGENHVSRILRRHLVPACQERNIRLPQRLFRDWWDASDVVLNLFPGWFASPQPDWPPRIACLGFPLTSSPQNQDLPDSLKTFLAAGEKPILFTPGSAMRHGKKFFHAALRACEKANLRALFVTRYPDQLPSSLPRSIRHYKVLPFERMLSECAAIVHHGGIGTLAHAMAAGIPQLLMPMAHDQPDNSHRIKALGLGDFLYPNRFTPARIAMKLERLLRDREIKRRCLNAKEMIQKESFEEALLSALAPVL